MSTARPVESKPSPFTTRELIRRVLEYANSGLPVDIPGASALQMGGQTFYVNQPETHVALRSDLSAILRNDLSGPRISQLIALAKNVRTELTYLREQGELREKTLYRSESAAATVAMALLRLRTQEQRELLADIAQCQLPACGKFFFKSEAGPETGSGRRPYKYCGKPHMDQAQQPKGAERTRRWREKKARQPK